MGRLLKKGHILLVMSEVKLGTIYGLVVTVPGDLFTVHQFRGKSKSNVHDVTIAFHNLITEYSQRIPPGFCSLSTATIVQGNRHLWATGPLARYLRYSYHQNKQDEKRCFSKVLKYTNYQSLSR